MCVKNFKYKTYNNVKVWANQNVMCTQHVVKHNLVLDGMKIY